MAVGFRKSLFGFNCDDVVAYVEKTHKAFTEKEIVLKEQIEDLRGENSNLQEQLAEIAKAKAALEAKLKEFTDKYDEIERLSQNIGKLYLVAEANARAIMKEANACADISRREVQKNMASIDNAHASLSGVKDNVVAASAKLAKDIDELAKSLSEAREKIVMRESAAIKDEEDYRELIKVLSNG
ncbi:MAG: hypothetical protein IK086_03285 [Clostridia bacterium]|nr:hypothetical protein [Clostridia bacterium]